MPGGVRGMLLPRLAGTCGPLMPCGADVTAAPPGAGPYSSLSGGEGCSAAAGAEALPGGAAGGSSWVSACAGGVAQRRAVIRGMPVGIWCGTGGLRRTWRSRESRGRGRAGSSTASWASSRRARW